MDDFKDLTEVFEEEKPKKTSYKKKRTTKKKSYSKPKAEVKVEKKEPVKLISFDAWFRTLGRPDHHKAGLKAYAKTKGKKSKEAWDRLFKNYFKSY